MTIDKIYQDSVIAGAAIRDGKGKRIDTTYAKKSDIPSDTEKLTMSYADETLTFSYPDTSYGVVTFDLTPTNGTLEVTTPAIKKATNMYKVVKNKDITYNYTASGYKAKSGTVNVTEDTTITVVLEAGAGGGGNIPPED